MGDFAEKILILDFGSPSTQLVARRIRRQQVYCEILPCTASAEAIRAFAPKGIVLSGGPHEVPTQTPPIDPQSILALGVPILALGHGFLHLVGRASVGAQAKDQGHQAPFREEKVRLQEGLALFEGAHASEITAWMSPVPGFDESQTGFAVAASTAKGPAALVHSERPIFGLAFHPESPKTQGGDEILGNFLRLSGCKGEWTMASFAKATIRRIRDQVGEGRVICGLSGGVDSSVAALLIHQAIGDQLQCVFVDHGLLRKGEREQVREMFIDRFHVPVRIVDAKARFLGKLAGVTDPEAKRKIIGHEFIEVFDEAAKDLGEVQFLAQGTVYADIVESVSLQGKVIKSHHNVGGLPETMKLDLVEPLRELFKDEVRALGRELGMPDSMVERQPFPGPGLAIRCLGEVSPERVSVLQEADAIVQEEIVRAELQQQVWQGFAVLLPIRTVGSKGLERTYEETCAIRAVQSEDAMTADWCRLPFEVLERISSRICTEVQGIGRVVYDITSKPPGTIEWE